MRIKNFLKISFVTIIFFNWHEAFICQRKILLKARKSEKESFTFGIPADKIRAIAQKLPVCIDALDEAGRVVFWNEECERVTGYSAKEIVGNPDWAKLLHPDEAYRQKLIQKWAKRGNRFRQWEVIVRAKNGQNKVISWTMLSDVYPVPGWQIWGIGVDITKRFEEEQKLKKNYQSYKLLIDIQHKLRNVHVPEKIASVFLDNLRSVFNYEGGLVLLYHAEKGIAEVVSAKFTHSHYYHADYKIPLKYLLYYERIKQGQVVYVDDLTVFDKSVKITSLLIKQGMKTGVLLPLRINEEIIGSLSLFSSTKILFSPEQEKLLNHAADLLSLVLYNNKLIEQLQTKLIDLEQKSIAQLFELRRSESRLRAQYESIPIPTYTWQKHGEDFILIDYNDMAMAATYGKISEYLGHKASEIYRNIPELVELLNECFDNEISMETQIESVSSQDHSTKYFLIKLAYVAPDLVLMHQEDITEEMHAKQRIHFLEETLEQHSKAFLQLRQQTLFKHGTLLPLIERYRDAVRQVENLLKEQGERVLAAAVKQLGEANNAMDPVWQYLEAEARLFSYQPQPTQIALAGLIEEVLRNAEAKFSALQSHVYLEITHVRSDEKLLKEALSLLLEFILKKLGSKTKPIIHIITTPDENGRTTIIIRSTGNVLFPEILSKADVSLTTDQLLDDLDLLTILLVRQILNSLRGELQIISEAGENDTAILLLPGNVKTDEERD